MSTLPPNKPATVAGYISDLGYCCPWAFFQLYPGGKWTQLVADRLGVTPRAVRYCREKSKRCAEVEGCKRLMVYKLIVKRAAGPDEPSERKDKNL